MANSKILIIDDDSRNIFALSAVLKAKGYPCLTATGAQEGLDLLEVNTDITVVLMDMMMPGMDGYEAISRMRNNPLLKDIPVIAVTAQAMMGDKERCLDAGAVGYISKPINVEELIKLLDLYILAK
jgi:two-component system cell cycle response regulator DivK